MAGGGQSLSGLQSADLPQKLRPVPGMPGGVSGFNSNGELVVAAEIPIEELSRPPAAASSKQPVAASSQQPAAAATKTMTNKKKREEPPNPCPLCDADMNKGCGKVHKCMDTACGRQICCDCHVRCDIGASSKCAQAQNGGRQEGVHRDTHSLRGW